MPKVQIAGDFLSGQGNKTQSCIPYNFVSRERNSTASLGCPMGIYFQIRSHWSLTWEVISRWTKSAISSFSPVSQSTVGNSESQLGVFTMWQAQRHLWSCQRRGLSNLLRNQMQQIKYRPQLSIWGLCLPAERRGWVAQCWGWGWWRHSGREKSHTFSLKQKNSRSREHFTFLEGLH